MIITRTPLRVSLFGGGTDLPAYYLQEGGCVLTSAIDKGSPTYPKRGRLRLCTAIIPVDSVCPYPSPKGIPREL